MENRNNSISQECMDSSDGGNEKKRNCRKSPWRFLFAALAVYGALKLFGGLWVNIVYWVSVLFLQIRSEFTPNETYSVGIIGGADGPTAVFLTAPVWVHYILPVLALLVGVWGYLHFSKLKQK